MDDQSNERRGSTRVPISPSIVCQLKVGGQCYEGGLKDMSLSGCFIALKDNVQTSCQCEVDIIVHGENSHLKIEGIAGNIIRSDEEGAAIQFDSRLEWFVLLSSHLCSTV